MLPFTTLHAQKSKRYEVRSPDGRISVALQAGNKLQWSVEHKGQQMIVPSLISLQLADHSILGENASVSSAPTRKVNAVINAINYKKATIPDQYNELTLNCKGDFGVIFRVYNESPLQMLSDNPTIYKREKESTDFITKMPKAFDETVPLDGKIGQYVALARRKGDTWFAGAMSNWTAREIVLDLSFLPEGHYEAEIFKDGMNADRDATDYKREIIAVSKTTKQPVKLYPGGCWAAQIYRN